MASGFLTSFLFLVGAILSFEHQVVVGKVAQNDCQFGNLMMQKHVLDDNIDKILKYFRFFPELKSFGGKDSFSLSKEFDFMLNHVDVELTLDHPEIKGLDTLRADRLQTYGDHLRLGLNASRLEFNTDVVLAVRLFTRSFLGYRLCLSGLFYKTGKNCPPISYQANLNLVVESASVETSITTKFVECKPQCQFCHDCTILQFKNEFLSHRNPLPCFFRRLTSLSVDEFLIHWRTIRDSRIRIPNSNGILATVVNKGVKILDYLIKEGSLFYNDASSTLSSFIHGKIQQWVHSYEPSMKGQCGTCPRQ